MSPWEIFVVSIYTLDILFVISLIFLERKNNRSMVVWILAFMALPLISWFFYIMWGQGPRFYRKSWSKKKVLSDQICKEAMSKSNKIQTKKITDDDVRKILQLNTRVSETVCFTNNEIDIYTDANKMYEQLKIDLENAKSTIHILSYIYRADKIGKEIRELLVKKAKAGVKVKVCFDDNGNLKTSRYFFLPLVRAGGEFYPFFPSLLRGININFNYSNHRKIIVVDGKIGYVGGMNIGDEYRGLHKKIKPWRDTHIRIQGGAVIDLQRQFLQDFYCAKIARLKTKEEFEMKDEYFPENDIENVCPVQIISSGPDREGEGIKFCYERMIYGAEKEIYIQTPYFVPDESILTALIIAALSGVKIHLMIPGVYDQLFPYRVTCSYMKDLLDAGVKVYKYNGFIHSKTMVMDDQVSSIGTANMDIRSFALNFEVNAIIYDKKTALKNIEIFKEDIKNSKEYTLEDYRKRKWHVRLGERFFRIFASLM